MKKGILLLGILIFCLLQNSNAQLKIDLQNVQSPSIQYLKMGNAGPSGKEIRVNNLYMEYSGVPQLPVMGEFHYSRMDHRYWKDTLLKMKASGINIVSTYVLWSLHEELEGQQKWSGNFNLRKFVELCHELGLKVHMRIGPYSNAEIRNGALPDWVMNNKQFTTRSNDPLYLAYVRKWYESVYAQIAGLQYKDGGAIMAVQLENEYVTKGMVISHLMNLKKMAVETGFDLPLYSMTHWMDSEYPKGEIIPYAGHYIETPWTARGKEELPPTNAHYFSYNRISNNIGTDIIKVEGEVESLGGVESDSPYFTCEVGVGSTSFYHRRAIIPEEMAGANINLRLGCGVNLMGYYMYVGGSNPVGEVTTLQSSGPRVGYDYQAPVREFGTLGIVMKETKKLNYFMNHFGSVLAPAVAYLPTSNRNTENLQWAVRSNDNSGFLFCSNYLYKNIRKEYKGVQFTVKLKDETILIPSKKVNVRNEAYFLWPFNQKLDGILLKYATVQPICAHRKGSVNTYFFFEDDGIDGEYSIDATDVDKIEVENGTYIKNKNTFFVNKLTAGKDCIVRITKKNGEEVRLVTLTEKQSDDIWTGKVKGEDFVAITNSSLVYDNTAITIMDDHNKQEVWMYEQGRFGVKIFDRQPEHLRASFQMLSPMHGASWIKAKTGNKVQHGFAIVTLSSADRVYLRYKSESPVTCKFNGEKVEAEMMGEYVRADLSKSFRADKNHIEFDLLQADKGVVASIEVLLKNGSRFVYNTNATWTGEDMKQPVNTFQGGALPHAYAPQEHLAVYQVNTPDLRASESETRLFVDYKGDIANAYIGNEFVNDSFYDGSPWILSLSRYEEKLSAKPLIIRIDGLKSADAEIYFDKRVRPADCVYPSLTAVDVKSEYRYTF